MLFNNKHICHYEQQLVNDFPKMKQDINNITQAATALQKDVERIEGTMKDTRKQQEDDLSRMETQFNTTIEKLDMRITNQTKKIDDIKWWLIGFFVSVLFVIIGVYYQQSTKLDELMHQQVNEISQKLSEISNPKQSK